MKNFWERFSLNRFDLNWGFWVGLVIFIIFLFIPTSTDFDPPKRNMLAIAILMGIWWMTEALPLGITALLPLVLYPILGIMLTSQVSPNYMHHLVFLFMGGFVIAISLQEWNLHRRFALYAISILGTNPRKIILAFMIVAAILSMWISNTATAVMMLPIGLAVINQVERNQSQSGVKSDYFAMILMLGIAYSSSIGGMATIIGTPPNIIFTGIFGKFFPGEPEISFIQWMIYVLPLAIVLFFLIWIYLVYFILKSKHLPSIKSGDYFKDEIKKLGPLNRSQKWVLALFCLTALLWIFRADFTFGKFTFHGWPHLFGLENRIQDSTIAIGMAMLFFLIPNHDRSQRRTILGLKNLLEIPWDILLLFGGGFALAQGIKSTGLAEFLGHQLHFLGNLPPLLLIFVVTISVIFFTEFTSNTAVATTILPIIAAISIDIKLLPLIIMLPATIAASCAFMLPVATPPNAIVFGSRFIPIQKMVRIGFTLNIVSSIVVSLYFYMLFNLI